MPNFTPETAAKRRRLVTNLLKVGARLNMKQKEIAELLGVHESAVSAWKHGALPIGANVPNMEAAIKLLREREASATPTPTPIPTPARTPKPNGRATLYIPAGSDYARAVELIVKGYMRGLPREQVLKLVLEVLA